MVIDKSPVKIMVHLILRDRATNKTYWAGITCIFKEQKKLTCNIELLEYKPILLGG